jgi:hypothetical protein
MGYLAVIFIIIIVVGLIANHELAHDKERVRQMLREYSYKTYSPGDKEEAHTEEESGGRNDGPGGVIH